MKISRATGPIETAFYGDLVYKFTKMQVWLIFRIRSEKISYITDGYNTNAMRQSAC